VTGQPVAVADLVAAAGRWEAAGDAQLSRLGRDLASLRLVDAGQQRGADVGHRGAPADRPVRVGQLLDDRHRVRQRDPQATQLTGQAQPVQAGVEARAHHSARQPVRGRQFAGVRADLLEYLLEPCPLVVDQISRHVRPPVLYLTISKG
jgi:hypothetical protein